MPAARWSDLCSMPRGPSMLCLEDEMIIIGDSDSPVRAKKLLPSCLVFLKVFHCGSSTVARPPPKCGSGCFEAEPIKAVPSTAEPI